MRERKILFFVSFFVLLSLVSCWKTNEEVSVNNETQQVVNEVNNELTQTEQTTSWQSVESKVVKSKQVYTSPGWQDEVEFSITVQWNVVENVQAQMLVGGDMSHKRTQAFNDWVVELKWKTIEELSEIQAIWGSSLTTQAFKTALKEIQ